MSQESLGNTQPAQKTQEHVGGCVSTQTQPPVKDEEHCCSGACEVHWKPVRVSVN